MTSEVPVLQKFDQEQMTNRLLEDTETEDDFDEDLEKELAEYDQIAKDAMEEQEQWEYGHSQGILDALESLMSFREEIGSHVLLAAIHKIAKRKLFDPPF